MFYDNKLYGKIAEEIQDSECINAFNKYQYISADERILALNSIEFERFTQDKELNTFREKFHVSAKLPRVMMVLVHLWLPSREV